MPRLLSFFATTAPLLAITQLSAMAQSTVVDPQLIHQMQETLRQQQEQLKQQAEQIKQQYLKLDALQQQIKVIITKSPSHPVKKTAKDIEKTVNLALQLPKTVPVTSGNDKIRLSISGQLDRALNIADDGGGTRLYHVDNNASNSRIRFVGTARISDDLQLGTRIELAISPDNSGYVSQTDQAPGDHFNQRWAEISLQSKTLGKLSLGKGDTASKGTAFQDISLTDLVQYSGIHDIAGGMMFRKKGDSNPLTTIRLRDAFKNMDGLGRHSRLRYDSPSLFGFTLAGSLASNQRSDLALYWGAEGYGFRTVGGAAVGHPHINGSGLLYDGSLSLLHVASGLNLTVSGGMQEQDLAKEATNLYTKLGWIARFTSLGYTAFGIDYTNSANTPASGDRGYSIGGAIVQAFENYATELYLQHRLYSLKLASGVPLEDIQVSTVGVRVKF